MATISKSLLINTPLEFYNVIKDKPYIVNSDKLLTQFRDYMSLYINGCNCSRTETYNNALNLYKKLGTLDSNISNQLKESIDCGRIVFTLSGAFIFEI
jgi:hypothetical protein